MMESHDVLTPQRGIEAVPAWGPPKEIKFLTCFQNQKSNCLVTWDPNKYKKIQD